MHNSKASDKSRQTIRDFLTFRSCTQACTLRDIAQRLHPPQHEYEVLSDSLSDCVQDGSIQFEYAWDLHGQGPRGLVFFAPHTDRPALKGTQDTQQVLTALLGLLSNRSDGRGDANPCATFEELHQTLGKAYSADDIVLALREGIRHDLVRCFPRVQDQHRSEYISFRLAQHTWFTVLAYDVDATQSLCFHVCAGSAEAAIRKVQTWALGRRALRLLGTLADRHAPEPVTGDCTMRTEIL